MPSLSKHERGLFQRAVNPNPKMFVRAQGRETAWNVSAVGTISHSVVPAQSLTPCVRYGDWPLLLSLLIIFGAWLARSINTARHG
jgi:apolipoprotein N-acyltransferase